MDRIIFAIIVMITIPGVAYAMGDPAILYWFGLIASLQVGIIVLIIVSKNMHAKGKNILLFITSMLGLWGLAINYKGPEFGLMYLTMIVIPLMLYFIMVFRRRE